MIKCIHQIPLLCQVTQYMFVFQQFNLKWTSSKVSREENFDNICKIIFFCIKSLINPCIAILLVSL